MLADLTAQVEHGSVCRHKECRCLIRADLGQQPVVLADNLDTLGCKACVLETQRHIIRTHAGNQYACKAHLLVGECLEVNIPDPADVRAVREAVVEQERQLVIALIVRDQVDDLIEAGRILDQHHARLRLTELELLGTAEAAFKLRKCADGGLLINADNVRDSGLCGGVVDVVAARQVDVYLVLVTEDVQHDVG